MDPNDIAGARRNVAQARRYVSDVDSGLLRAPEPRELVGLVQKMANGLEEAADYTERELHHRREQA
jgi:hypothetical protein